MSNKHKNNHSPSEKDTAKENPQTDEARVEDVLDTENGSEELEEDLQTELTTEQKLEQELAETKAALEKEKKEYLFLMADFDNYRKNTLKDKAELIKNAAERTLRDLLPIVDDFERGLEATKTVENASAVREGMDLIYQKLVKFMDAHGVKAMDTKSGTDFDPDIHEAVAMIPAPSEDLKGKIIDTTQKGYTINGDKVVRHAKVVVGQ